MFTTFKPDPENPGKYWARATVVDWRRLSTLSYTWHAIPANTPIEVIDERLLSGIEDASKTYRRPFFRDVEVDSA